MKRLFIAIVAIMSLASSAMADLLPMPRQKQEKAEETTAKTNKDAKYLLGAVPEKDGIVTFTKTFRVPGKTQAEIFPVIAE